MYMMSDSEAAILKILKALHYAAYRHRKQFRKGEEKTPYINHLIQVANLLSNEAGESDQVLLSAAILHDIIEDTVNSEEEREMLTKEIRKEFGEEILALILEVTDDKTLLKEERKRLQIEKASSKSAKAKKLIIADKTMNIRDLVDFPPVGWNIERIVAYLNWSEKVFAGLGIENSGLDNLFKEALERARNKYINP
jgi:GTP diphosphokinase / guanosine-3',5'-bis(diphosphate) 3'-diphosphatase